MPDNTSDHHPIRMSSNFKYKNAEVHRRVAVSFRSSHNFNMACSIPVSSIFSFIWRLSICVQIWAEYHSLSTLSQLIFFANDMPDNTSDHHPIRMSSNFKYKNAEVHRRQNNCRIAKKINWDKVDKEW
jgi:hypothetical protein